ncbi:MAG: DUF2073 domain-containing protein [archaeon]|nr:DUF2073 domain-containing protein [archaeon]MCR4323684.1 DUF2073 domain-containing protein [Nanoarchaeota archaeon]
MVKKRNINALDRKSVKRLKEGLTIHFMPYSEISKEDSIGKIKKIIGLILDNKIIILQGKLSPEEETRLIETSMTLIGNIKGFQGIETAAISGEKDIGIFNRVRKNLARILVGERDSITIIGPATVVKDIKRDPKKLELMLSRR